MDEKSALLNQLRIDRDSPSAPSGKGRIWLGAAAGVLVAAGIAIWWWTRPVASPVHVVAAQALAQGGSAGTGSILDASGYVVARRQAAVASKITGKMVELDIEEGDRVKAGQIIAKLDDTNIRASLNAARAQAEFAKAAEVQIAETTRKVTALVDEVSKNAPAGSENAIAFVKSAIGNANAGYEQVAKTTKQAVEALEANMNTATNQLFQAAAKANGRASASAKK